MGISSTQYGSLLIPIIMTKITPELRLRVARETKKDIWEIRELLDLIKQEVEAREASEQVKVHAMKPPSGVTNRGSNYTASSLVSNSSIRCVYCNEAHYSASCKRVSNIRERKDILLSCFNCLKTSHKRQDCDSHKLCRHCHRKHHQSICSSSKESDNPPTSSQAPAQVESTQPHPNGIFTTNNTTSASKQQPTVLLQTAQAIATSNPGSLSVTVRVLFDSGSQLSKA